MTTTIQTLHTSNMTYNLLNINNNHNNIQMNMINFNDSDLLLEKPDKAMISTKKCAKRINSVAVHQPASVARRNARERNRVKQVNNGFATLRQHIPSSIMATSTLKMPNGTSVTSNRSSAANKKLSKVETLRSAVEYIRCLQQLLEDHDENLSMNQCTSTVDTPDNYLYQNALNSSFLQELQQSPNGSVSPTPSFSSTNSSLLSTDLSSPASYCYLINNQSSLVYQQQAPQQQQQQQQQQHTQLQQPQQQLMHSGQQQFQKLENFENFQPTSPEDEELLDAIAWWQQ